MFAAAPPGVTESAAAGVGFQSLLGGTGFLLALGAAVAFTKPDCGLGKAGKAAKQT